MSNGNCFRLISIPYRCQWAEILAQRPQRPALVLPVTRADLGPEQCCAAEGANCRLTDFREWQLGSETVTAPWHVLRTRPQEVKNRFASASGALVFTFTFRKQLKPLSGSYINTSASTKTALASSVGSCRSSSCWSPSLDYGL